MAICCLVNKPKTKPNQSAKNCLGKHMKDNTGFLSTSMLKSSVKLKSYLTAFKNFKQSFPIDDQDTPVHSNNSEFRDFKNVLQTFLARRYALNSILVLEHGWYSFILKRKIYFLVTAFLPRVFYELPLVA